MSAQLYESRTMYTLLTSVFFMFLSSQSFVESKRLWVLINVISSTYLDLWSNESSQQNLAEKLANFASCRLLDIPPWHQMVLCTFIYCKVPFYQIQVRCFLEGKELFVWKISLTYFKLFLYQPCSTQYKISDKEESCNIWYPITCSALLFFIMCSCLDGNNSNC